MHTHAADEQRGIGGAARRVAEHARALVRLEIELAGIELKRKVAALGAGIAMLAAAATLALFGLGFLLATLADALDSFLPRWLSLLVVALLLLVLAAILGLLGLRSVRRGTPPVPEQAIEEATATTRALKADGG